LNCVSEEGGVAEEDGPFGGIADEAVGAFDEGGVLGDAFAGGVEEEFAGVVAGLSVDVDGELPFGFFGIGEPPVVGEPGVGVGEYQEVAGAGVIDVEIGEVFAGENHVDAGEFLEQTARVVKDLGFGVDVGDLMVDEGEGLGGFVIDEQFAVGVGAGGEQAGVAKGEVGEDGGGDIVHAVVAEDDGRAAIGADACDEGGEGGVDVLEVFNVGGVAWAEALQVVIEVGDVDELQIGVEFTPNVFGGLEDPLGAGQAGHGAPVIVEGEGAELGGECGVEVGGVAPAGGEGFAVGRVGGLGGKDDVGGRVVAGGIGHGVLPEEHGDLFAGALPEARGLKERIGLFPEGDFLAEGGVVGEVEMEMEIGAVVREQTIGDDAVLCGRLAGGERGLHGGGDRGQDGTVIGLMSE